MKYIFILLSLISIHSYGQFNYGAIVPQKTVNVTGDGFTIKRTIQKGKIDTLIIANLPDTSKWIQTVTYQKVVKPYVPIKIPAIAFVNPYSNVDTQADYIRPAVNGSTVPLQVSFNVPFSGETKIGIEYANGNTPAVNATVTIAGVSIPVIALPKTTDWNTYSTVTQTIAAQTGQKVVTVSFLPNVNFKSITFSK